MASVTASQHFSAAIATTQAPATSITVGFGSTATVAPGVTVHARLLSSDGAGTLLLSREAGALLLSREAGATLNTKATTAEFESPKATYAQESP